MQARTYASTVGLRPKNRLAAQASRSHTFRAAECSFRVGVTSRPGALRRSLPQHGARRRFDGRATFSQGREPDARDTLAAALGVPAVDQDGAD
jgi:hypothetical protein